MIFVANNCDALCTCKILTELLQQSNIQYTCVPVFSYVDIEAKLEESEMPDDIRSLIFLNCGAKIDFTELWFNQKESEIKTFVFDSQRPINHNNVATPKSVYVVDFGDINIADCPEDADFEAMQEEIEGQGEDVPVDGEKEYQLITNGGKREEEKKYESKEQEGEGDDDDFDQELEGKKRKRDEQEDPSEVHRKRLKRVNDYYSGCSYSKASAYLVY
jgi:cell division control protein 45